MNIGWIKKISALPLALVAVGILGLSIFLIEKKLVSNEPAKVCVSSDIAMIQVAAGSCLGRAEIKSLLREPVLMISGQPAMVSLTPPDSASTPIQITSCTEYIQKIEKGWYALSQRDMDKESGFKARCGLLTALALASTPRQSYVTEEKGLANLDWLPESLLPQIGEASSPGGQHERSVAELVAAGECTIREAISYYLSLVCNKNDITIRELARADFNGDGYGDMLVVLSAKPIGGTTGFTELQGLTRNNPNGILKTFALDVR